MFTGCKNRRGGPAWGPRDPPGACADSGSGEAWAQPMTLATNRMIALCIVAHAAFALLGAYWLYINIVVRLVSICLWPFWWAVLGFKELRTGRICWSLAAGTVIYLPSLRIIYLMVSFAQGKSP